MLKSNLALLELAILRISVEVIPFVSQKLRVLLPKTRSSNPVSRAFRPLFEANRFKSIIGVNLAAAIIIVSRLGNVGGQLSLIPTEVSVLSQETIQVLTETRFRFPLETSLGYSQGFHRFHRGVDIRAPRGSQVYSVASGKVIEVEIGRWGYGHKVVVKHENDVISTLYAHLDQVNVIEGDQVTKNTILGNVGMTGWTTGPHLHFEVITDQSFLNPKQILPNPISS